MEIFERKVVKINETSKRMSRLIPFSCLILIFLLPIRTKTVHMGSSFLTWIGFEVFIYFTTILMAWLPTLAITRGDATAQEAMPFSALAAPICLPSGE